MGNLFIEKGTTRYEFFNTADGSPSICMSSEIYRPEAMHHREGALAESLFVYDGVLTEALALGCAPHILSVGLGCGYNETIAVARWMKTPSLDFYLESFEGDEPLREEFRRWLQVPYESERDIDDPSLSQALHRTFTKMLEGVARSFELDPTQLKARQLAFYQSENLILRDWLTAETSFTKPFGVIFFDAFSGKSTPQLWTDEFLDRFLAKAAGHPCGLATYAATGSLNRALKKNGFVLRDQKGFSFKRQSTRAFRA